MQQGFSALLCPLHLMYNRFLTSRVSAETLYNWAFLLTADVNSGYLSYHSLPVSLNHASMIIVILLVAVDNMSKKKRRGCYRVATEQPLCLWWILPRHSSQHDACVVQISEILRIVFKHCVELLATSLHTAALLVYQRLRLTFPSCTV